MDRLGLSRTEIPWTQPRSEPVWEYEPFQRPDGPPGRLVREVRFSNHSWWLSVDACFSRASAATYALSRDLSQSPAPSIGIRIYMSSARPTPVGRARTLVLFVAGGCDLIAGGSRTYELTLVWRDQAAIMPPSLGCSPNEALMAGSHLLDDVERIAVRVAEAEHRWDTGEVEHLIVDIDAGGSKGRMVRFGIPR